MTEEQSPNTSAGAPRQADGSNEAMLQEDRLLVLDNDKNNKL